MNKRKQLAGGILLVFCLTACVFYLSGHGGSDVRKRAKDSAYAENGWTVTQYGPREINSMFYTVYHPEKGLVVVDGGWTEDAGFVRETIKKLGGKVDAWILTHPHQDHIGAFTALYPDLQGIEIERVYTVDMASPEACQKRASWDSTEAYEEFLKLEIPMLQYVSAGDVLEVCGLEIDVLSAYGKQVKKRSKDYLNDGSMMFKVKGETQSMLFCADVGKSMSDYLLKNWEDNLKADYIQMGHHGNGGLKADFYTKVSPRAAFFDAPDWLMFDTTGNYTTPQNAELMESLGSEIVSFQTQPNAVVLH